uniref:Uncharacterized protein n=1 Tax=Romanomermis culicivorax TaxID=13658 RepID=A0A915KAQ6_ROMCU
MNIKFPYAPIFEVGLDFTPHYIKSEDDKVIQRQVFKYQIDLAKEFDLPLYGARNVLLHAFSGNYKSALPAIKAGYYFSVPPCSINSDQKKSLFAQIPLDQLLLETDSPVLGPIKGERNEPANIIHGAKFVAELKNIELGIVVQKTTENAMKLFPKLQKFMLS